MIKKSDIQSLIVTADREFKHRAINFFNNAAFNSEKLTVGTLPEASSQLINNAKLLNLLIDGSVFGARINEEFVQVTALFDKPDLYGIMYLPERMPKPFEHQNHGVKNLGVYSLPFNKIHFNEIFHRRRSGSVDIPGEGGSSPFPAAAKPPVEKKPISVTAFEASNHVRDTIQALKALDTDRGALEHLHQAGQRFNGIVGTFAFFTKLPGYKELRRLAIIIDRISRHYVDNAEIKKIEDSHFKLLIDAAKCAYSLLQDLREQKPIPADVMGLYSKVEEDFKKTGIQDAENVTQADVDSLIENLTKPA